VSSVAAETATRPEQTSPTKNKGKHLNEKQKAERKLAYILVAPAVIAMLLVTAYPVVYALWLSLRRSDLRFPDASEFVGLQNYITVLTSSTWWEVLGATAIITLISVAIELVLGMALALVMHRIIFARGPVRAAILIPYGIITVVAALSWQYMFTPENGFLPFGISSTALLADTTGQYIAIIVTEVWKTTPFMALLLLAGLAIVPDELHEAAKVDGASAVQRFFRITLPLMKPAILVALLFRTLDAFRLFDSAFVLTNGDFRTVSILGYDQLITRLNLGLGSAVSVLIFLCVLIIATLFVKGFGTAAPGAGDD
jgi:multiple sugar transport system permease protein